MATKPDKLPEWALNTTTLPQAGTTNKIEPSTDLKNTGFDFLTLPEAQGENWWRNRVFLWLQYQDATGNTLNNNFFVDSGTANTLVLDLATNSVDVQAYTDRMVVRATAAATNTGGAATINVNALGVKSIKDQDGNDLAANQIVINEEVEFVYDLGNDYFVFIPALTTNKQIELKSGRKNYLINGNFEIWQRNTSFTDPDDGEYTADRWSQDSISGGTGAATVTRQAFTLGQTDVPNEPEFFLRHDQTTAVSSAVALLTQRIEGVRNLAGNTVTISFWAKVASGTKTFAIRLRQEFGTGGSPSTVVSLGSDDFVATTAWQKFESTIAVTSISGKTIGTDNNDNVALQIRENSGLSTFTLDLAQVQIEVGTASTDFEFRPIAEELALAQRYYWKSFPQTVTPAQNAGTDGVVSIVASNTGRFELVAELPVTMRAIPSLILFNPSAANNDARNLVDSTDTNVIGSSRGADRAVGALPNPIEATDANDVIAIHITADAEL